MRSYDNLICPRCGCRLSRNGGSLFCFFKHCYDLASSGYVNLVLSGAKTQEFSGDNKEMMQARRRTMDNGYYKGLADELVKIIARYPHDDILDVGCGEGYITGRIAGAFEESKVRGADLSKNAILLADKRYKNAITTIEYKTRKNQLINPKIIIANQLVVLRPLSLVFFVKSVKQVLLIIFNYIPPPIIAELKP